MFSSEAFIKSVLQTLYNFKGRSDQVQLIPHLKAFTTEIKNLFPGSGALYFVSLGFPKTEISEIYLFFAQTSHRFCFFNVAQEFNETNLQIWKDSAETHFVASRDTFCSEYIQRNRLFK